MPKGMKGFQKAELNPMWAGDNVTYTALHLWVRDQLPSPVGCDGCGKKIRLDLANKSGRYLRDLNDWEWLCRSCHMEKDGRKKHLSERNKTVLRKQAVFSNEVILNLKQHASTRIRDSLGRFMSEKN